MSIPAFRYLRWFKERAPRARISLAHSGMDAPPESVLPVHSLSWRLDLDDLDGYRPLEARVRHHLRLQPGQVCVVPGCTYATHVAARVLLTRPGSTAMVESPTYELLVRVCELSGAQVRRLPRPAGEGFAPRLERLEEAAREGLDLLIVSVPHNPSGRLLDPLQVPELVALAEAYDFRILVDEVYLDFHPVPQRPYRSLAGVSDRFVVTGSLTKVQGLANLRVGWVAGPPGVVDMVRRLHEYLADRIPAFDAQAAVLAFDHMDGLLGRAYAARDTNWPAVRSWAASHPALGLLDPGAGINVVVRFPESIDTLAFAEKLFDGEGVLVAPAEMFGSHSFLRLSYGIEPAMLAEGLRAIARAFDRSRLEVGRGSSS